MSASDWFDEPGAKEAGLRFECTMCGNCCSGPAGYVLVSDAEAAGLAKHLGVTVEEFLREYTHMTEEGRSLTEKRTAGGLDCVFLDRTKAPGKAVCGVYRHRPAQCRTWPFWPSVVKTRGAWERAGRGCPGMGKGRLYTPLEIRARREKVDI